METQVTRHNASEHLGGAETRQRLLEAAGEVFATRGFHDATVREIVAKANANIAAVNYHFGGKEELYAATLDYCFRIALEKYPPDWGVHPSDSPDLRLKAFVRSFVFRALEDGKHSWHSRLVTHEMNRPTAIFQQQLDRVMKPMAERLHDIVQAIVARPMGEDEIWRASASVISQVVFYKHCNTICERMMTQKYDVASLEQLADHIYRFALAGLRGLSAVEPHGGSAGH